METAGQAIQNVCVNWSLANAQIALETIKGIKDPEVRSDFYILLACSKLPIVSQIAISEFALICLSDPMDYPSFITVEQAARFVKFLPTIM